MFTFHISTVRSYHISYWQSDILQFLEIKASQHYNSTWLVSVSSYLHSDEEGVVLWVEVQKTGEVGLQGVLGGGAGGGDVEDLLVDARTIVVIFPHTHTTRVWGTVVEEVLTPAGVTILLLLLLIGLHPVVELLHSRCEVSDRDWLVGWRWWQW